MNCYKITLLLVTQIGVLMHASEVPNLKNLIYKQLASQLEKKPRCERSPVLDAWEDKAPNLIKSSDQTQDNFTTYLEQEQGWRYPQKQFVLKEHANFVHSMALVPHQDQLVSASWDATIRTWNLLQGKCIQINSDIMHRTSTLTSDGQYIIFDDNDDFVVQRLYDGAIKTFPGKFKSVVPLYSNDVNLLATINSTNQVSIWNLKKGDCIAQRTVLSENVALSADLSKIAFALENILHIEDFNTGISHALLVGHTDKINTLAITPDSKKIISAGKDKTIKIWDLESYQCLKTIKGHDDAIYQITLACKGKYFISFAHDKTRKIWDVKSGEEISTLSTVDGNFKLVMDEDYLVATDGFVLNVYKKACWKEIIHNMPESSKSYIGTVFVSAWNKIKRLL